MAPSLPAAFRGKRISGPAAAEAASRVAGPFSAAPAHFVEPVDQDDLALLVRWAADEDVPLVPRGGGTGMPGGNLGPGVVLALDAGFRGIEAVAGEPGTFRVGAGIRGMELEAAAEKGGRTFPPMPSSGAWATLGGMVANNAAGARSFGHGPVAHWVRAVAGVDAAGERFELRGSGDEAWAGGGSALLGAALTRAEGAGLDGWPRLRKNSSGYGFDRLAATREPAQLLVGSEGTLALITEIELATAPAPVARGVAVLPVPDGAALAEVAQGASGIGQRVAACEFLGRRFLELARLRDDPVVGALVPGAHALVLLEVEGGDPAEVEASLEACLDLGAARSGGAGPGGLASADPATADRLWALRRAASPIIAREAGRGRISTQFIEDCVVPVGELGVYLAGLEEILGRPDGFDAVIFGHAGDGNVHVNPLVEVGRPDWQTRVRRVLDEVVELVCGLGGTLAGEHGDGRLRAPFLPRVWGNARAAEFEAVKAAADPSGILNPGVVVPLPGQDPLEGLTPRPRRMPGGGGNGTRHAGYQPS